MNVYNTLIKNIIRTDDNYFDYHYKPSNNIPYLLKVYFSMLIDGKIYKNRMVFFYDQINNKLIENNREEFIYLFYKIQHYYHILLRFVNDCKFKKAKIIVDTDLQLNKIQENEKDVLPILHCGKKYLFKIQELVKHINTSLTNSPGLFSDCLQIKNPYNGTVFEKSILYNIYFYSIFNTRDQIELLHKFFLCNFNLNLFEIEYEPLIREYAIKSLLNNSTIETLYNTIIEMIDEFNSDCLLDGLNNKISIDKDFPKEKLVKIMKPYLKLYYWSLFSLNVTKKTYMSNFLYKKLKLFNQYNKNFGRKIIKTERIMPLNIGEPYKFKIIHLFSDEHIKFSNVKTESFMNSHLKKPPVFNDQPLGSRNTNIQESTILFTFNFDLNNALEQNLNDLNNALEQSLNELNNIDMEINQITNRINSINIENENIDGSYRQNIDVNYTDNMSQENAYNVNNVSNQNTSDYDSSDDDTLYEHELINENYEEDMYHCDENEYEDEYEDNDSVS